MSIDKRQLSPVPDTHPLSLRLQSSGWRQGICRVWSEVVKNVQKISTNTILIRVLYGGGTMTTGLQDNFSLQLWTTFTKFT